MKRVYDMHSIKFLSTGLLIMSGLTIAAILWWYHQDKTPIKIGLATTLTGRAASWGSGTRNGVMLAVEEKNAAGGINGRPIELIIKDDQLDPGVTVKVDRELIDQGVVAILGHYLSTPAVAALPVVNKANILLIGSASSHLMTGLDDNFIRVLIPVDKRAGAYAGYSFRDAGLRKMVIVYDMSNPKYSISWFQSFKKEFETLGGTITDNIGFDPRKNPAMPDLVQKIIDSGAEGIFLVTNEIHGALICQHMRIKGYSTKIIDSGWATAGPSFIRHGGKATDGVITISEYNHESSNPTFKSFKNNYESRFEERLSLAAQLGYETAQILFQALTVTQSPQELKETILKQKVFNGPAGDIVFDSYGDPQRSLFVMQVKGGKLELVGEIQ